MIIFPHWLEFSHRCTDLKKLCHILNIDPTTLNTYITKSGTTCHTLTINNVEAFSVTFPKTMHGTIKLRGSFFDNYPNTNIKSLWDFVKEHNGNPLQLDISYLDNECHIDFDEYRRMSLRENYQDYLTGSCLVSRSSNRSDKPDSNNRQGVPDVHANHPLIHYGNVDSRSYVKLYRRPSDQQVKFELTLKDKKNIVALLNLYPLPNESADQFHLKAKEALVKALSFVTPSSKRAKRPCKIASYQAFLGGEIKPINWTALAPAVKPRTYEDKLKYHLGHLVNLMGKQRGLDTGQVELLELATEQLRKLDELTEETEIEFI